MGTLPSGLPEAVAGDEELARFLTSSSQLNATMVKPAAFLPSPRDGNTSVFRHGRNPQHALWQIGAENIVGRTLHGAAIVKARYVREARLDVVSQEPPPRHANITGWPSLASDPEMEKAARKVCAAVIAQYAEVVRV